MSVKEFGVGFRDHEESDRDIGSGFVFMKKVLNYFFWAIIIAVVLVYIFVPDKEANNKADKKTETTTTISKTTINEAGRKALVQRWNDPGFTEAGFPQKESFWIFIKSPPNPADAYAALACKIAKSEYNVKGFTITVWDFNKKKYGKARCY